MDRMDISIARKLFFLFFFTVYSILYTNEMSREIFREKKFESLSSVKAPACGILEVKYFLPFQHQFQQYTELLL